MNMYRKPQRVLWGQTFLLCCLCCLLLSVTREVSSAVHRHSGGFCQDEGLYGFSGGTPFPPQLIGSHGPGTFYEYSWKKQKPTKAVAQIRLVTGLPNGIDTIYWGKGSRYTPGDKKQTFECSTGWGCMNPLDPSRIWESGILFHHEPFGFKDVVFCHIMELKQEKVEGVLRSVLYAWDVSWVLGEAYRCPESLVEAMNGKNSLKEKIHYLRAPNTGRGLANVPRAHWHCQGKRGGVIKTVI